jgi:DNA-binding transcriptional ArsR family regulator
MNPKDARRAAGNPQLPGCVDEMRVARLRSALDPVEIKRVAEKLGVLSHPTRVRILWALTREAEICVSELVYLLRPLKQSSVSHALRVLRDAGLVDPRSEGRSVYYSLKTETIRHFLIDAITNAQKR